MRLIGQLLTTPKEIKSLPIPVKRMTLVIFIYFISWGLVVPFLPLFLFDILGSYAAATFISALVTIFSTLWVFPVGEFLDRYSQRKIVRIALLLYLPIWPFLAIMQTFVQAVIYQLYHSVTMVLLWSSSETYVRTHSPDGKRSESFGLYDAVQSLSLIVGAIVGGVILEYFIDIRLLFVVAPPFLVIAAFLYSKRLPKDPQKSGLRARDGFKSIEWKRLYIKELRDFWLIPGMKKIWPFIIFLGFFGAFQSVIVPLFAAAAGASFLFIGILFALYNIPLLLEMPFSVLADTWSARFLVITGSLIAAAALLGFGLSEELLILFPLALIMGIAVAMLTPSISGAVGNKMTLNQTGELTSVFTASLGIGGIIGLLVLGPVADIIGIQQTFFIGAGVMFFSCIFAFLVWDPQEENKNQVA